MASDSSNYNHPITIIQLCASHISTYQRMRSLVRQLDSIVSGQAPIWLSISCEPELRGEVCDVLDSYKTITIRFRDCKLSQFQHYALLAREIPKDAWCLMCDDDDLCHPSRVAWYVAAITKNDECQSVFCCNGQLNLSFHDSITFNKESIESYVSTKNIQFQFGSYEYWMFATRSSMLQLFCDLHLAE
jgi:hypothetical protein